MSLTRHDSAEELINLALKGEPGTLTPPPVAVDVKPLDVNREEGGGPQNKVKKTITSAIQSLIAKTRGVTVVTSEQSPPVSHLGRSMAQ